MKKIGLALMVILVSCTTDNENVEMNVQDVKQISVNIEGLVSVDDASSRVIRNDEGKMVWERNDTLGIFPNVGGQVEFPIDEKNVGTLNATFNGGGWALKSNYSYSAYSPFNFYNRNVEAVPFSYDGQVQNGNNSVSHIGKKYFMASAPAKAVDGSLVFSMGHRGALTELALTLPEARTYTSVDIYTSEVILPIEVTFNLQTNPVEQKNVRYSNHYSLKLNNVKTTAANEVVTVWFTTPAIVDKTKTLKAVVRDSQNFVYVADIITSSGAIATVNFPAKGKRELKASPVLTDGFQAVLGDWIIDGQNYNGEAI